ncbi:MAG: hypothetical protein AMXMBFR53_38250 [Gemmatimonadota bacterium]
MTMSEHEMDELTRVMREEYNPPPAVPREEMWAVIQAGMDAAGAPPASLEGARRKRPPLPWRQLGWAAAAAAVLGLGVSIGRVTAPEPAAMATEPAAADASLVRVAAVEHLSRTDAMLRMVRADGRDGTVDPAMGAWGRTLLTQTRLLLDTTGRDDPAMRELLEDLELVLVQIVAVSEAEGDEARTRSELSLALEGLEQRDVLPRIQAVVPTGSVLAGT